MPGSIRIATLLRRAPRQYLAIIGAFGRWVMLGALAGGLAGPASALFLVTLRWASDIHAQNPWTLWMLPFAGIAIHLLYATFGAATARGNNLLIEEVHLNRRDVPLRMAPLGFLAPVVTLVFGGAVHPEAPRGMIFLSERRGEVTVRRSLLPLWRAAGFLLDRCYSPRLFPAQVR